MSEGGGGSGPDIGPNYQNAGPATYSNPPSQPPTPSSTVQDPPSYHSVEVNDNSNDSKPNITNLHSNSSASGLPPFSSFAASDVNEGLGGRLAGDGYLTSDGISSTRVMELSGWDYCYTDGLSGRYLERGDSMPVMIPQPQYRPWESKQDGSSDSNKSTLPSFQSQFGEELVTTLTTLTPAACSPAPSVQSPSLPSFHTLSAVNPRYPLVPAPVQAREIPSIQQQFLDERHIHLFQGPPGQNFALQPQNGLNGQTLTSLNNGTTLTTLNNAQYHPQIINNAQILPSGQIITPQSHHLLAPSSQIITSNGHIISSSGGQGLTVVSQNSTPTVLTVVKTEPVNIVELKSSSTEGSNLTQLHHANFQNPLIGQGQQMDSKFNMESPPRGVDGRKKERRKIRASSLESSNESDGAMSVESSGQVAAVSSTAGFKSPMTPGQITNEGDSMITDTGEKQTKKKRKRCGECIGCQRKDNCGDCAPCRNDKSHQICKMRRCEKLTEKKHLLAYNREDGGVSYRGRGRGRGRGSRGGCRGKSARPGAHSAQVTSVVTEMNSTPGLVVGSGRDNVKIESGRVSGGSIPPNPNLTPAMAVPFYAGTEVWPASNPADPWTAQGQFIHQIDDIRYQHYPGYQATGYQQPGFITDQTSAFQPQYANSSNGNPSTSPAQGNVTPRSSGSYTQVHTPTPSPNPSTPHVNGHRNGINVHYIEENYVNGTSYNADGTMVPPASTTPNSRSSSGQIEGNETNNKTTNYMSGNEIPGYPLNSPQCQSSCNSSGYPGQSLQSEYGDQSANETSYQPVNANTNHLNKKSPSYTQPSPGTYQNYQNYNQISPEQRQKSPKQGMSPGSCHPSQKPSGMYPQNSPNSNPSPQNYQQISPGQNRNAGQYENRNPGNGNMYMEQQRHFNENYAGQSPQHFNSEYPPQNFTQSSPSQDKSSVNARIKSMIMNKHQMSQGQRPNSNYSASTENHIMSPNREMMSPNHQGGQGSQMNANQMMSPSHQGGQGSQMNANQMMSPSHQGGQSSQMNANQMMSPSHQGGQGSQMNASQMVSPSHQGGQGNQMNANQMVSPGHQSSQSSQMNANQMVSPSHQGGQGNQMNANQMVSPSHQSGQSSQMNANQMVSPSHQGGQGNQMNVNQMMSPSHQSSQSSQMNANQMVSPSHQGGQGNQMNANQMMSPSHQSGQSSQMNANQMMSPKHQSGQSSQMNANQMMSPKHQSGQNSQMNTNQMMSPSNQGISNNQITSPNSKDAKSYIKRTEYGEKKQGQKNENPNHFLAFSHHLRDGSVLQPEGGGVQNWADPIGPNYLSRGVRSVYSEQQFGFNRNYGNNDGMCAMENIMRFASVDFDKIGVYACKKPPQSESQQRLVRNDRNVVDLPDPIRNLEVNFPTKRNVNPMMIPCDNALKTESFNQFRDCRRREKLNPPFADSKCDNFIDKNQNFSGYVPQQDQYGTFRAQNNLNTVNNNNYCWYKDTDIQSNFKENMDWRTWNLKSEFSDSLKSEFPDIKTEEELSGLSDVDLSALKVECCDSIEYLFMKSEFFDPKTEDISSDTIYQRISYAPNAPNMEVIDLRFVKTESLNKEKWEEYQEAMRKERKGSTNAKRDKENYLFEGDGGPITLEKATGSWCCRRGGIETPSPEHLRDGCCQGLQTADEILYEQDKTETQSSGDKTRDGITSQSLSSGIEKNCKSPGQDYGKEFLDNIERLKNNVRSDVPDCQCFPPDKYPPEPGSYYTHLGAASSLSQLRKDVESRTGQTGKAVRIEKICYTGKEGKTTQGCPLAKWVIRRSSMDEKFLLVVKHRQGHTCSTAWIVVCVVAWEGVPSSEADKVYTLLTHKLNRFGLPTTRRCATNEPRTCACQGLDPETCGASFSFGCSWSMYYNGCKYARSKTVRKFRLSVRSEEQEVEERMHVLATILSPLYNSVAPEAFHNQTKFEREASECRLGFKPGRPFSGVTACFDFCSHSHRDLHNMNNGCTVVVSLTKHRSLSKPEDEQLHVLPLYIMDETDEHGCKESQEAKYKNGSIECLKKFPCEVRVRAVPLQPCRRHGKKRKDEDVDAVISNGRSKDVNLKSSSSVMVNNNASPMHCLDVPPIWEGMDGQLQSSQVSSTVMDSPVAAYQGWNYHGMPENDIYSGGGNWNKTWTGAEHQRKSTWANPQLPTQWDYCGYVPDHVVPDSTTHNQICSPNRNSVNMNARSNMIMGNFGHNPPTTWHQQVTENYNFNYEDSKFLTNSMENVDGKRDLRFVPNSKNSPHWSSCPMTPHNSGFDAVFRIPKGRPPSRPNPLPTSTVSGHFETYLKPFPKDNHSTSIYNSTKEADMFHETWGSRNVNHCKFPFPETGTVSAVNVQNPFNSNQSAFNTAENYNKINFPNQSCMGNNPFGSQNYNNYASGNQHIPMGNWPEYMDDSYHGYGCKQNFSPVPERWDSHRWDVYSPSPFFPLAPETQKPEPIGEVIGYIDNEECFKDSQMGGVAIALSHGSVLFECAKHELHATTALRRPDRLHPTRISLVFYQHRNLNRAKHGWDEWEEKMRLRKLGINISPEKSSKDSVKEEVSAEMLKLAGLEKPLGLTERILVRVPTYTTTTWTTLFPMTPCMVTGPYQEGGND